MPVNMKKVAEFRLGDMLALMDKEIQRMEADKAKGSAPKTPKPEERTDTLEDVLEVMYGNGSAGKSSNPEANPYDDWSEDIDDRDPGFWEDQLGGPDDNDIEDPYR